MAAETTLVDNQQFDAKGALVTRATISSDDDEAAAAAASRTSHNVFSDPKLLAHYTELYEKAKYECRHVLDPNLEWTAAEERRLVWKLDWHVCLWAVGLFVLPLFCHAGRYSSML